MRYLYFLIVTAAFAGAVGIFADSACAQQNPLFQHPAGQITTQVVSCVPAQNYTHAPLSGPLQITFAPGMQIIPASLTDSTFVVMGQQSGWHRSSSLVYDSTSNTITYIPAKPFFVGELVTAVATKKIMYDTAGQQMYLHGFAWQFYGMVIRQTRATFVDTEHINTGGSTILSGFASMDSSENIDLLVEHAPADIIAFNGGDGINYQNSTLNIPGNMFPADYKLRGMMDVVVGFNSCTYDSNEGNDMFQYGKVQPFNAFAETNLTIDLDYSGIPEIVTQGLLSGMQTTYDTVNVYSVIGNSVIKNQSIHVGVNSGDGISTMFSGDFNNDGAIDVGVNISGRIYILYNDGTGNLLPPQQANSTTEAGMNGWVAADMDNDGLLDLTGAIIGLGVEIDHNNGDGTFTPIQSNNSNISFSKQTVSSNFNVGDCNGDGLMDAVLTPVDLQTGAMFVVTEKNMGNDSLKVNQIIPEGNNLGQGSEVFLGDLDKSGVMGMAISFDEAGIIAIFKNDSAISPLTVIQNPVTTPDGYLLSENFPNPSSQISTITYSLPTTQTVNVSVYNINGQLMATVVNGLVSGGMNYASYDCSHLSTGVYIVRLVTRETILTKPFIHFA